jgi:glycosyltransferase involved in cell wall biosynthesis
MCQVSFVIIAFNESNGIQKCIESIFKQKTKLDYEVILIDDGSTDLTAEIVKRKFGSTVQVYSQQNVGRGQSRFNGIQIAKAPLIAMVDGDIVLPENWLETCFTNLGNFLFSSHRRKYNVLKIH